MSGVSLAIPTNMLTTRHGSSYDSGLTDVESPNDSKMDWENDSSQKLRGKQCQMNLCVLETA